MQTNRHGPVARHGLYIDTRYVFAKQKTINTYLRQMELRVLY